MSTSGVLNVIAKVAGGIGLGLIAIDAHCAGRIRASSNEKNHKADSLEKRHMEDMKLDSPSVVESAVKKRIFQYSLDENATGFFHNIGGYLKGFGSMFVSHAIPFALAIGTFVGSRGIRGGFSKFCGAGLIAYGGAFLLREIFGIGKSKE